MKVILVKKSLKSMTALLLTAAVITTPVSAMSLENKDETVYMQLNASGGLKTATVVNAIQVSGQSFVDYGDYAQVKNLTDAEVLTVTAGVVKGAVKQPKNGPFYYEGTLKTAQMPWHISIVYFLNGKIVQANELAGKAGHLKTVITVKPNLQAETFYYDNYTLQMTAVLDMAKAENLTATHATVVTLGSNKQIAMMTLPGEEKTFTFEADVNAFEMDSMTMSAVHANSGINLDIEAIDSGFKSLNKGSAHVLKGSKELTRASGDIHQAAQKISLGFDDLGSGMKQTQEGSKALSVGTASLHVEMEKILEHTKQLAKQMAEGKESSTKLMALAKQLSNSEDPQVKQLAQGTLAQLDAAEKSQSIINQLSEGFSRLVAAQKQLSEQMNQWLKGFDLLLGAVAKIDQALQRMTNETAKYESGMKTLALGQEGLNQGVLAAESKMTEAFETLSNLAKERSTERLPSFVSEKNTPQSVQFVMKTPEIAIENAEKEMVKKVETLTFWDRLMALFL